MCVFVSKFQDLVVPLTHTYRSQFRSDDDDDGDGGGGVDGSFWCHIATITFSPAPSTI